MAPFGGVYITHMRNEGDFLLEAIDEAIRIGREGGVPVEIYHLKAAGKANWPKMPAAIAKIDSARAAGQDVQADMYIYSAGRERLLELHRAEVRGRRQAAPEPAGSRGARRRSKPTCSGGSTDSRTAAWTRREDVMVVGFTRPELKKYEGKRLTEIAKAMGKDWTDALIDLNIAEKAQARRNPVPDERRQRAHAAQSAVDQVGHRRRRRRSRDREGAWSTRAPTGTSRACSASTCATNT